MHIVEENKTSDRSAVGHRLKRGPVCLAARGRVIVAILCDRLRIDYASLFWGCPFNRAADAQDTVRKQPDSVKSQHLFENNRISFSP